MNVFKIALCLVFASHFEGLCSNTNKNDFLEKNKLISKKKTYKEEFKPDLSEEQMQNLINQSHPRKKRRIIKMDDEHDTISYEK